MLRWHCARLEASFPFGFWVGGFVFRWKALVSITRHAQSRTRAPFQRWAREYGGAARCRAGIGTRQRRRRRQRFDLYVHQRVQLDVGSAKEGLTEPSKQLSKRRSKRHLRVCKIPRQCSSVPLRHARSDSDTYPTSAPATQLSQAKRISEVSHARVHRR